MMRMIMVLKMMVMVIMIMMLIMIMIMCLIFYVDTNWKKMDIEAKPDADFQNICPNRISALQIRGWLLWPDKFC